MYWWIHWLTTITQRKSWGRKTCSFSLKRPTFEWVVNKQQGSVNWSLQKFGRKEYFACSLVTVVPQLHEDTKMNTACTITYIKSPSFFIKCFGASLTNLTPLLPQSPDSSCYVSRPILAPPLLWLQQHTDLRAHDFAHSCDLWRQPRFANVTGASSWRPCGINTVILGKFIQCVCGVKSFLLEASRAVWNMEMTADKNTVKGETFNITSLPNTKHEYN